MTHIRRNQITVKIRKNLLYRLSSVISRNLLKCIVRPNDHSIPIKQSIWYWELLEQIILHLALFKHKVHTFFNDRLLAFGINEHLRNRKCEQNNR